MMSCIYRERSFRDVVIYSDDGIQPRDRNLCHIAVDTVLVRCLPQLSRPYASGSDLLIGAGFPQGRL